MFDGMGVFERTRKPWTLAISFAGQSVMIGLAILIPLVATEALPRGRLVSFLLPEPPSPPPRRRAAQSPAKPVKLVPFQASWRGLQAPFRIPDKVAVIQDPDLVPATGSDVGGVPFGLGDPRGPANDVIRSLVRAAAIPPPPPVAKEPAKPPLRRIVVGGRVQAAKLISGPLPVYPPLAKQARISGAVRLQAIIARDGTIMDLRAVSGHPLLIPAALAAVKQWVFQPTCLNGDPVEVASEIEVTFALR